MARCWLDFQDPNGTVFLAGAGRSGTTWLGDLMNARNDFRVMFEPFFRLEVPLFKGWWIMNQYLRPGVREGRHADAVRAVVAGRVHGPWVDQFNTRRIARRRLIKDIRANYLLKWLRVEYPAMPIVFILRHPCATALSQVNSGWKAFFQQFQRQPDLMADHLEPFRDLMREDGDPFESRVLIWCLLNVVPLRQFKPGEMQVVFYEELCRRPAAALPPVFETIGVPYGDDVLDRIANPSAVTRGDSAIVSGADPVKSWRDRVPPGSVDRALRILARFGLDRLYGEGDEPRVTGDSCLRVLAE